MDLYRQQSLNRRRTFLLVAAFLLLFAFLGLGFDLFVLRLGREGGIRFPVAVFVAAAISLLASLGAWLGGARAVLSSCGARPADGTVLTERTFRNCVEEMSIASGLPCPQAWIIPDADLNAFATGRDPAHAAIAVTEGCLPGLSREELQGVVAHEISHIRNLDVRLMTMLAALVGMVTLLSDWAGRSMRRGSSRRGRGGGPAMGALFAVWLAAVILSPLISRLIAMAVSRSREYLADATAAELTRNPEALARALEKLESAAGPTRSVRRGIAHLCIVDPTGSAWSGREGGWSDLMATHPPIRRRIEALRAMA